MGTMATVDRGADGRSRIFSEAIGAELIVNAASYGKVDVEAVLSGEAEAIEVTATQDGRQVIREWQDGAGCGRDVYYERWTTEGRAAHGWVDAESRKIVQAG